MCTNQSRTERVFLRRRVKEQLLLQPSTPSTAAAQSRLGAHHKFSQALIKPKVAIKQWDERCKDYCSLLHFNLIFHKKKRKKKQAEGHYSSRCVKCSWWRVMKTWGLPMRLRRYSFCRLSIVVSNGICGFLCSLLRKGEDSTLMQVWDEIINKNKQTNKNPFAAHFEFSVLWAFLANNITLQTNNMQHDRWKLQRARGNSIIAPHKG